MGMWFRVVLVGATVLTLGVAADAQDTFMEAMVQWRRQKSPPAAEAATSPTPTRQRPVIVPGRRRPVVLKEPQGTIVIHQPTADSLPVASRRVVPSSDIKASNSQPSAIDSLFRPHPPEYAAPELESQRLAHPDKSELPATHQAAAPVQHQTERPAATRSAMDADEADVEFAVPQPPAAEEVAPRKIVVDVQDANSESTPIAATPSEMITPAARTESLPAAITTSPQAQRDQSHGGSVAAFPVPAVPVAPAAPAAKPTTRYTLPDEMIRLQGVPAHQKLAAREQESQQDSTTQHYDPRGRETHESHDEQAAAGATSDSLLGTAIRAMHKPDTHSDESPRRPAAQNKSALLPVLGVNLTALQERWTGRPETAAPTEPQDSEQASSAAASSQQPAKQISRQTTKDRPALLPNLGANLAELQERWIDRPAADATPEKQAPEQASNHAATVRQPATRVPRRKQTLIDMLLGEESTAEPETSLPSGTRGPTAEEPLGDAPRTDQSSATEPSARRSPTEHAIAGRLLGTDLAPLDLPTDRVMESTSPANSAVPAIEPKTARFTDTITTAAEQIAAQQRTTGPPSEVQHATAITSTPSPNRLESEQLHSGDWRQPGHVARADKRERMNPQGKAAVPSQPASLGSLYLGEEPSGCGDGSCDSGCAACGSCCPPAAGGWFGGAGVYYLKPHWDQHIALAVVEGADVNATVTAFDYEFDPSLYVYGGYLGASGIGIRGGGWQFDQTASRSATVTAGTTVASMEILDLELATTTIGQQLRASSRTEFQLYDLEAIALFGQEGWSAQIGGGMRYLSLDQDYRAEVFNATNSPTGMVLDSYYSFQGVGPTMSLEVRRPCGLSGMALYGQGRFSTLFGETEQRGSTNTSAWQRQNWGVIGMGELELGAIYTAPMTHFTFVAQTGLVGQIWWGAGNATNSTLSDSNLGLFGLRSQVGFTY